MFDIILEFSLLINQMLIFSLSFLMYNKGI